LVVAVFAAVVLTFTVAIYAGWVYVDQYSPFLDRVAP